MAFQVLESTLHTLVVAMFVKHRAISQHLQVQYGKGMSYNKALPTNNSKLSDLLVKFC